MKILLTIYFSLYSCALVAQTSQRERASIFVETATFISRGIARNPFEVNTYSAVAAEPKVAVAEPQRQSRITRDEEPTDVTLILGLIRGKERISGGIAPSPELRLISNGLFEILGSDYTSLIDGGQPRQQELAKKYAKAMEEAATVWRVAFENQGNKESLLLVTSITRREQHLLETQLLQSLTVAERAKLEDILAKSSLFEQLTSKAESRIP